MPRPSLRSTQDRFIAGLLGPRAEPPKGLLEPECGLSPQARFGIYRHAYRARLQQVLRGDHSAVARALGESFDHVAEFYAEQRPSAGPSLRDVGAAFPGFLARLPLPNAPALCELARFERLLLDAFDAADATRCDALVRGEGVLNAVRLHPSVRRFEARWNTLEHWHAARDGADVPPWSRVETRVLVWRSRDRRASFRVVGPQEFRLCGLLLAGATFAEACEDLAEIMPPAKVPGFAIGCLGQWIDDGLVCAVEFEALLGRPNR